MKELIKIDIDGCWFIPTYSDRKALKTMLIVIGFEKMTYFPILQMKLISFCNKNSLEVWCLEDMILSGQPYHQIRLP